MNSWAKILNIGCKKGLEFWGTWNDMNIYKGPKCVAKVKNFKQLKLFVINFKDNSHE